MSQIKPREKMVKEVTVKEDGRLLIYYRFVDHFVSETKSEQANAQSAAAQSADSQSAS